MIKKYRTKPEVIEAVIWDGTVDALEAITTLYNTEVTEIANRSLLTPWDGVIHFGDYCVKTRTGLRTKYTPEQFNKHFEEVNE